MELGGLGGGKGKGVTCYGFWGLEEEGKRCHMLRFLGFGGRREKVSHVTVSGDWRDKGNGVTCYGFWGLNGCSYTFCLRANTFIQGS